MRQRILLVASLAAGLPACAAREPAREPARAVTTSASVGGAAELARRCDLPDDPLDAPKFELDSARLSPQGERLMADIARCLVTGPLAGARVRITGYADPRGSSAYNRQLGLYRATAAKLALTQAGVPEDAVVIESRGERDARGTEEPGFRFDRRVEVELLEPP